MVQSTPSRRCLLATALVSLLAVLASVTAPATWAGSAPALGGAAVEGSRLVVKAPKRGVRLTWLRCAASGARCKPIKRAAGPRYLLTAADVGSTVRAAAGTGAKQVRSKQSARVRPKAPTARVLPAVSGPAGVGATLVATPGSWTPVGRTYRHAFAWLRCSSDTSCAAIPGATSRSYATTAADAGSRIRVEVTATVSLRGASNVGRARSLPSLRGGGGSGGDTGDTTVTSVAQPLVSGSAVEGRTLHTDRGTWSAGGAAVSTTVAWQRCVAGACSTLPGATGADYTATAADIGGQLRVVVTATAGASSAVATSASTSSVGGAVPLQRTNPTLSPAAPNVGDAVTATNGTWDSPAPTTFTYQWQRCTPPGVVTCVDIPGATSNPYVTVAADATFAVRVRVTIHHGAAAVGVTSTTTSAITGVGPSATLAPSITGQAVTGQLLTGVPGSFAGPGLVTTAGRWQRCTASGSACTDIAGETGATYMLGSGDLGATIVYAVTATNPWGSTTSASAPTAVVTTPDPVNATLPTVAGALYATGTATVSPGTWTGLAPISYAYRWQRCSATGASCVDIAGATSASYLVAAPDIAGTLRVIVTATNAAHTATDLAATSAASGLVGASPNPVAVTSPTVTGSAVDGATLTWNAGTYTGQQPIGFTRQWQRCNGTGAACTDIPGATATTYALVHGDVGSTFRVGEVASNSFGTAPIARSLVTAPVGAAPPTSSAPATITGTTADGSVLTADPGTWAGTPPFTYAYQWQRCNSSGAACANVGSGGATYTLTAADVSSTVRVVAAATNAAGTGPGSTSAATSAVVAAPPVAAAPLPQVTGTLVKNATLSTSAGTFTGTAPFTYTYQWRRCTAPTACLDIPGATSATYLLVTADVGRTLRARVVAHSATLTATATADSAPTAVIDDVLAPPSETTPVAITGPAEEHATLVATQAVFAGSAPIAHALQWRRCDSVGVACADVSDAADPSGATYTLGAADVGYTFRVVDTGTNGAGSAVSTSPATAIVIETFPAINVSPPSIAGRLEDGTVLFVDDGGWNGSPPIQFTYAWYRCQVGGSACVAIPGETTSNYRLVTADVGSAVQVRVQGVNDFGGQLASSDVSSEVAPARRPVNSGGLPAIITVETTGIPETTQDLTANDGTWSGSESDHTYAWKSCDAFGEACTLIPGATGTTYTLPDPGAAGRTYRLVVTYTNPAGSDTAESPATRVAVRGTAPATSDVPSVAQDSSATITLLDPAPVWTGTNPMALQYEWMLCDDPADPAQCTTYAPRSDSSSYTTTSADFQPTPSWLRLRVWASNGRAPGGVASDLSNPIRLVQTCASACPQTCLCVNTGPPTITGAAINPGTLTGQDGTWIGAVALTFLHAWQRCDAAGNACTAIPGETGSTYDLTSADVGNTIRFEVIASTPYGNSPPEVSAPTAVVVYATPPTNLTAPSISVVSGDEGTVGTTVSVDDGTWAGSPAPDSFAYQWQRCDAAGSNCSDIADAVSMVYVLSQGDLGSTVVARVAATNIAGSTSEFSSRYPTLVPVVVQAAQPTPPPASSIVVADETSGPGGQTFEGHTLSVDAGTWLGTPTIDFSYQWQSCDAAGAACANLPEATGQTHVVSHEEVGSTLRVVVVGSNPSPTTASQTSDRFPATGTVLAAIAPWTDGSSTTVSIDGAPERTQADIGTAGTWLGTRPLDLTYQWQRCATQVASSCTDITGETELSYTPTAVDVNAAGTPYYLRLVETATNVAGAASVASSISTNPVLPGTAPGNDTAPSITGTTAVGNDLTADPGAWHGTDSANLTYTYQWARLGSDGTWHDLVGETSNTYTLAAPDANLRLRVAVVAHNLVGVSPAVISAPSAVIAP